MKICTAESENSLQNATITDGVPGYPSALMAAIELPDGARQRVTGHCGSATGMPVIIIRIGG